MQPINLTTLKDWLDTKEPEEIVGKTRLWDKCPVTRFLIEVNGFEKVKSRYEAVYATYEGRDIGASVSSSVLSFMKTIDGLSEDPVDITAAQALEVLEKCKKVVL